VPCSFKDALLSYPRPVVAPSRPFAPPVGNDIPSTDVKTIFCRISEALSQPGVGR
jgi:hypothetical protein